MKPVRFMNGFTLKIIAIITMVIDHIGFLFFPEVLLFRVIGRISFPIFCFLIVEGFYHTRNQFSYLKRLTIFAFLSEIPFDLAFHNSLFCLEYQNVFFTLALGLASIFCLEEMNLKPHCMFYLVILWILSIFLRSDYGFGGVLLISLFYLTKEAPFIRFLLSAFIFYLFFGTFELPALLAFIPIALYNGKRGPTIQMIFYWIYPLHMILFYLLRLL